MADWQDDMDSNLGSASEAEESLSSDGVMELLRGDGTYATSDEEEASQEEDGLASLTPEAECDLLPPTPEAEVEGFPKAEACRKLRKRRRLMEEPSSSGPEDMEAVLDAPSLQESDFAEANPEAERAPRKQRKGTSRIKESVSSAPQDKEDVKGSGAKKEKKGRKGPPMTGAERTRRWYAKCHVSICSKMLSEI